MKHQHPEALNEGLERYRDLLVRYHPAFDLISERGLEQLDEKLDDALAFARAADEEVQGQALRLLDLGSGSGLPGLVVALALPQLQVVLVERRQKRSAFLHLAAAHLGLSNVQIHRADVRGLTLEPVQLITAQAVGTFGEMYALTRHLHAPIVTLLSRKGPGWREEVAALEAAVECPADATVVGDLHHRGRLVRVRVQGGRACRF